jgi:ribosomal protein S18 acetylase RimI-like enzyme
VTRHIAIDDATMRSLERHETAAHAIPRREMRDLGHAVVLFDPVDPDPFVNRMASVRWPSDDAGFDLRLTETLALFAAHGRRPHVWPSPVHATPVDLVDRLAACGFSDIGAGHVMVLDRPALCGPVAPGEAGRGVTMHGVRTAADAGPGDLEDVGRVLVESFGAPPWRGPELAEDLRRTLDDPRIAVVLVRVDGEPAASAKATTFAGMTYLSSIGTRDRFRGRGLAGLATRHAVATGRHAPGAADGPGLVYLGVDSGNEPALRLYERLGFASVGESPDMLLE